MASHREKAAAAAAKVYPELDFYGKMAQAALRGFFEDPLGFNDMSTKPRRRAIRAVEKVAAKRFDDK